LPPGFIFQRYDAPNSISGVAPPNTPLNSSQRDSAQPDPVAGF